MATTAPNAAILNLESLPRDPDPHHLADYTELLCRVNSDGIVGQADVADRLRERRDLGEDVLAPEPTRAESSDAATKQVVDIFRHLAYRSGAFAAKYPFTLRPDEALERTADLDECQRDYIFLLLASSLGRVARRGWATLTAGMEFVAVEAFRAWLPPSWEVHHFGTAAGDGPFRATLYENTVTLASRLQEDVGRKPRNFALATMGMAGLMSLLGGRLCMTQTGACRCTSRRAHARSIGVTNNTSPGTSGGRT